MQNYKEMLLGQNQSVSVKDIAKDIDNSNDWEELYWIGTYLLKEESGDNDKLILKAFEKSFEKGLNITTNREYFLEATKNVAKLYFQFNMYDEAINKLMVLESNCEDLPDWTNLYYASAQIQTESIKYLAKNPEIFFKRIEKINVKDPESVKKRRLVFFDYLNKLNTLREEGKIDYVAQEVIAKKAQELNLAKENEFDVFRIWLEGENNRTIDKARKNEVANRVSLYFGYDTALKGYNKRIAELQKEIDKQNEIINKQINAEDQLQKTINELESELSSLYAGSSKKIKAYDELKEREKTLLLKCETLEKQLSNTADSKKQLIEDAEIISVLQHDVEDLKAAVTVWQNKYEKLSSDSVSDKDLINSLQISIQKKDEEILSLKATIKNQEVRIESAESAVRVAEEKYNNPDVEIENEEEFSELDIFNLEDYIPRNKKILIIGDSGAKEEHLRGKLKHMGFVFENNQLEFQLDYDSVKDYSSRIKPWSGKYAGIIVGPCPHKAKDIDGYSSFIEKIKSEEGYPPVVEARDKAGNLKISKESIGEAMKKLAIYLSSVA